jgi:DNA-directed RNA polymerase subunit RPC12/RpoP
MDYVEDDELYRCCDCGEELPPDAPTTLVRYGDSLRGVCPACWRRRAAALMN